MSRPPNKVLRQPPNKVLPQPPTVYQGMTPTHGTPTATWFREAIREEPLLEEASWVQCVAYRATDFLAENVSAADHLESFFKYGFLPNRAKVSVGFGKSTGGVATAKEWDGAYRWLDTGKYAFLVVAEGFYLPDCDRQNVVFEIKSYCIPGHHVLAGARIDESEDGYGGYFIGSKSSESISFNHRFMRPSWVTTDALEAGVKQFIAGVNAERMFHKKEYADVCRWLNIAPKLLNEGWGRPGTDA